MSNNAAARLRKVRKAIDEVLETGQSVAYDNRTVTSADLTKLRALELEYEQKASQEKAAASTRGRNSLIYIDPVV